MKKLVILLLCSVPVLGFSQAVYDPVENVIKMPIEMAARIDSMARLGKICSATVDSAEILVKQLYINKKYNEETIKYLETSIMFMKENISLLEENILTQKRLAQRAIDNSEAFKSERDLLRAEIRRDTWGKLAIGGIIVGICGAIIVTNLTPRR